MSPRPALDHLIGRKIEGISIPLVKSSDWAWRVLVEGNVEITNYDKKLKRPSEALAGSLLAATNEHTIILFRNAQQEAGRISFSPGKYSIAYPSGESGMIGGEEEETTRAIEDPSEERISEGPSKEWLDSQKEEDEEE